MFLAVFGCMVESLDDIRLICPSLWAFTIISAIVSKHCTYLPEQLTVYLVHPSVLSG